jgi:hypothetical protein
MRENILPKTTVDFQQSTSLYVSYKIELLRPDVYCKGIVRELMEALPLSATGLLENRYGPRKKELNLPFKMIVSLSIAK